MKKKVNTNRKKNKGKVKVNKFEQRKPLILDIINGKNYKPLKLGELANLLMVPKKERYILGLILDALVLEGRIYKDTDKKYYPIDKANFIEGVFLANEKGFGFVRIDSDDDDDIFIPGSAKNGAYHGDRVLIDIVKEKTDLKFAETGKAKSREGKVISILERGYEKLTGTYEDSKNFGFVVPDLTQFGTDIFIPKSMSLKAKNHDKVVIEITNYGSLDHKPEGKVIEILGKSQSLKTQITSLVRVFDLPQDFPEDVVKEADNIVDQITEEEIKKRLDLRETLTVTIDGKDAKDLDDAISIAKFSDEYVLGVHIADVSHFVKEGHPLDIEAFKRGTSNYLVDRVIPMLPKKLSNGVCSLNEKTDRLAMSCIMHIDNKGQVRSYEIKESIINVDKRMNYDDVNTIISKNSDSRLKDDEYHDLEKEYNKYLDMLNLMAECSNILKEAKLARGFISFDVKEAKFILNQEGELLDILVDERKGSHEIIEQFMLTANETIAEHFYWLKIPFIYRSHEEPDIEKIKHLQTYIQPLGYQMKIQGKLHPAQLQKLLNDVTGKDGENIIKHLALRTMQQAKYTSTCDGHFGLAAKYYTHFTSPIRRYPDLQIHRIIKESLNNKLSPQRIDHYEKILDNVAKQSSNLERRAEEAERETHKLLKASFMVDKKGKIYDATISGVTKWGIYCELDNTVEGLVPVSKMDDDYYEYDHNQAILVGKATGNSYKLGQRVTIIVDGVDIKRRNIDFRLYQETNDF